jgi:hypothetical protein
VKNRCLIGLVLVGLTACGGEGSPPPDGSSSSAEAAPREVRFVASDFAFEGPDTIEGGMLKVVLENAGETWHHLQLVRLPDGWSVDDFQEAMTSVQPGSPAVDWFVDAGGVSPPRQGGSASVTMMVEPGEYAVLCLIDTPDHVPHFMKGMIRPLTVTAPSGPPAELPPSDMTLTLVDYAFSFSEPPTSGSHVIRVVNAAEQPHEVAILRFAPGKTMDDLMAWSATYEGPAPAEPVGGVTGFGPGRTVVMEVDLIPGEYVAVCFVPDATDGVPHLEHGMLLPFTVS